MSLVDTDFIACSGVLLFETQASVEKNASESRRAMIIRFCRETVGLKYRGRLF